jgi:hypothetical protein
MTRFLLRRCLLGLVLVLVCLVPLALRPTATWSAATSSENSGEVAEQSPLLATGTWFGWQNLGNPNANPISDPAIGRNNDGRLQIFAWSNWGTDVMDRGVYQRLQTTVNGTSWSVWNTLGTLELGTAAPAVATNPSGRMEVFAAGAVPLAGTCTYRAAIKQIYQTAPNNGWSIWGNLGQPSTACYVYRPFLGMNGDGRLDIFTLGSDGKFYHRWQTAPSGNWSANWGSLPLSGVTLEYWLAVGNNADGRLALFAAGSNGEIYHTWQTTANNEYGWNIWTGFGKPSSGALLTTPSVGQNQDGRLQVFSNGSDGKLWYKVQVAPNSYWSSWMNLGTPTFASLTGGAKASRTRDGRLVVFSPTTDGGFGYIAQTQANGTWGSWASLGHPSTYSLVSQYDIALNQNGTMIIVAVDSTGMLGWNYERLQVFLPLLRR